MNYDIVSSSNLAPIRWTQHSDCFFVFAHDEGQLDSSWYLFIKNVIVSCNIRENSSNCNE